LDEIDWIRHRDTSLRSTGETPNVELTGRHALLRARRGLPHDRLRPFAARLREWESGGGLPEVTSGSEKLMLFRAALGRGRNDVVERIAAEMNIAIEPNEASSESELRILRAASALQFPFEKNAFVPARWRYASRNRLGQWHEIGSMPPLKAVELDALLAAPDIDWIACGDHALLHIEGISEWSAASRQAIASLFRVRAEHHRLRRLMDEESAGVTRESIEGIVGESPAMRGVY